MTKRTGHQRRWPKYTAAQIATLLFSYANGFEAIGDSHAAEVLSNGAKALKDGTLDLAGEIKINNQVAKDFMSQGHDVDSDDLELDNDQGTVNDEGEEIPSLIDGPDMSDEEFEAAMNSILGEEAGV